MVKQIVKSYSYTDSSSRAYMSYDIDSLLKEGWIIKISYPVVWGVDGYNANLIFIFEKDDSINPSIQ